MRPRYIAIVNPDGKRWQAYHRDLRAFWEAHRVGQELPVAGHDLGVGAGIGAQLLVAGQRELPVAAHVDRTAARISDEHAAARSDAR